MRRRTPQSPIHMAKPDKYHNCGHKLRINDKRKRSSPENVEGVDRAGMRISVASEVCHKCWGTGKVNAITMTNKKGEWEVRRATCEDCNGTGAFRAYANTTPVSHKGARNQ